MTPYGDRCGPCCLGLCDPGSTLCGSPTPRLIEWAGGPDWDPTLVTHHRS